MKIAPSLFETSAKSLGPVSGEALAAASAPQMDPGFDQSAKDSLLRLRELLKKGKDRSGDDWGEASDGPQDERQAPRDEMRIESVATAGRPEEATNASEGPANDILPLGASPLNWSTPDWLEVKIHSIQPAAIARGNALYKKQSRQQVLDDVESALLDAEGDGMAQIGQAFIVNRAA